MIWRPYEYVCHTKDPQWHDERRQLVTASDVSVLVGAAPEYWDPVAKKVVSKTKADLVADKRGESKAWVGNRHTWWGSFLEATNAQGFAALTGARIRLSGALLRSKATPTLGATLDGLVRAPRASEKLSRQLVEWGWSEDQIDRLSRLVVEGLGVLELKNTERSQLKEWHGNQVPLHYWWQVQAQMYVTGLRWGLAVAKVGAADMRCTLIEADDMAQMYCVDMVEEFSQEVWGV